MSAVLCSGADDPDPAGAEDESETVPVSSSDMKVCHVLDAESRLVKSDCQESGGQERAASSSHTCFVSATVAGSGPGSLLVARVVACRSARMRAFSSV